MKRNLFVLILSLLLISEAVSQRAGNYWSNTHCPIRDKSDSAFLISTESKVWKAVVANPATFVYDGAKWGTVYQVRMSRFSIKLCLTDSVLERSVSIFDLSLLWNREADLCHVMAFSPVLRYERRDFRYYNQTVTDSAAYVRVPLSSYYSYLAEDEIERHRGLVVKNLAESLHGVVTGGDTITRFVTFTVDSNEFLPQASIFHLLEHFQNGLFSGRLHGNRDKITDPGQWMSKSQIENTLVCWDSTNSVEDPNNKGTYILAPVKYEGQFKSLIIYEQWIPLSIRIEAIWQRLPQPWKSFRREVVSYGLKVVNGKNAKVIWLDAKEVDIYLKETFNMIPYEETFRAERFKTMKIFPY
jgi:hypothetical protein